MANMIEQSLLCKVLDAPDLEILHSNGVVEEMFLKKTGCTWIAIQNEIAYLKEVKANTKVIISSKTIEITDRVSKVEILMKSEDQKTINAVLWITVIYFNMKTRQSEALPENEKEFFEKYLVEIDEKEFKDRVLHFRKHNKANNGNNPDRQLRSQMID